VAWAQHCRLLLHQLLLQRVPLLLAALQVLVSPCPLLLHLLGPA
jgi:hypothetical protein